MHARRKSNIERRWTKQYFGHARSHANNPRQSSRTLTASMSNQPATVLLIRTWTCRPSSLHNPQRRLVVSMCHPHAGTPTRCDDVRHGWAEACGYPFDAIGRRCAHTRSPRALERSDAWQRRHGPVRRPGTRRIEKDTGSRMRALAHARSFEYIFRIKPHGGDTSPRGDAKRCYP